MSGIPPGKNKYAFLTQAAPLGYVAGLGRGASGFTTRSDIGPARETVLEEEEGRFDDPENETGLFAGTVYERDDAEADAIYQSVDDKMADRHAKRKLKMKSEDGIKLQDQFADLKRKLGDIPLDDWLSIPEVGNLTGKRNRKKVDDRSFVVPDSVLLGSKPAGYSNAEQDGTQTGITDLASIGEGSKKLLRLQLDQQAGTSTSLGGTATSIDPQGYLTSLSSSVIRTETEIGDTKKARDLLKSVIRTNTKHAPGWIAAARLEELDGKLVQARKLIQEGCEMCTRSEDVWLEAARLNVPADAKIILAQAVGFLPRSVNIWMRASELETSIVKKKSVMYKALEHVPESIKLWKAIVNMEENIDDAKILLARATAEIPSATELWLALARVETPENARQVLNKARKCVPTSHDIWIAAGRLQEQQNMSSSDLDKLMSNAVTRLRSAGAQLSREQWIKEAEKCEEQGSPLTAGSLIRATIHLNVEEEDRLQTWIDDAMTSLSHDRMEIARVILAYAITVFPKRRELWLKAAELEKSYGSSQAYKDVLKRAVENITDFSDLWLMLAKEQWNTGEIDDARESLLTAYKNNVNGADKNEAERIALAIVKFEVEAGSRKLAEPLLERFRLQVDTAKIWMRSITFEREYGNVDKALALLEECLPKFPGPSFADGRDKLHMIKGQLLKSRKSFGPAREAYAKAIRAFPKSIPLRLLSSRLEELLGVRVKARAILEQARLANPKNVDLWLESAKLEERAEVPQQAKSMISKGLQECPAESAGPLWDMLIWMEPRPMRRKLTVDALKKVGDKSPILLTISARLFWTDRKLDKARDWFGRAIRANTDYGDTWAWWLKFENQHGTTEQIDYVRTQCAKAAPRHGPLWISISKGEGGDLLTASQILDKVVTLLPS